MVKLVIVRSPAKCKKIEGYLGPGYKCVASFGHFRGITNGLKDIDVYGSFRPNYNALEGKSKYINNLRKHIRVADDIVLATDDDREGEAIAWHICDYFSLPVDTTKRIIFHEITKPAILKAIANPGTIDMNKVNAQMSRQVLDILIGYMITPTLWSYIARNSKSKMSAGRCQTPSLALVYDNHKEIEASPGEKSYKTTGIFTEHEIPFELNYSFKKEKSVTTFLDNCKTHKFILIVSNPKTRKKKPPIPMTTSALQQKASNELGFSPKKTMQLAQTLYEKGLITYMRTDSKKYSGVFIEECKEFIEGEYGEDYLRSEEDYAKIEVKGGKAREGGEFEEGEIRGKVKDKKAVKAQEAHEGIRPTYITKRPEDVDLESPLKRLYTLIRNITLESCICDAECLSLAAEVWVPKIPTYSKAKMKHNEEKFTF